MTTAILREQAREAEANIDFALAANLYRKAIAVYPSAGDLADLDVANLTRRVIACESMVIA